MDDNETPKKNMWISFAESGYEYEETEWPEKNTYEKLMWLQNHNIAIPNTSAKGDALHRVLDGVYIYHIKPSK